MAHKPHSVHYFSAFTISISARFSLNQYLQPFFRFTFSLPAVWNQISEVF